MFKVGDVVTIWVHNNASGVLGEARGRVTEAYNEGIVIEPFGSHYVSTTRHYYPINSIIRISFDAGDCE